MPLRFEMGILEVMNRVTGDEISSARWFRHKRTHMGIRVAVLICAIITGLVMLGYWPLAWVPAALAATLYCMAHFMSEIDRRACHESALPPMPKEARDRKVREAEESIGVKALLTIVGGLAAIAIVLAAVAFDWQFIAIGALGIFLWFSLLGLPFWVAAIIDEVETEHEQLTGEHRTIH